MISPSGGVASRTLPAGTFERDDGDDLADGFFDDGDRDAPDVDPFVDLLVDLFVDERFLDGPHVVMTLNTVPRGCHTEP